jgi:hypothetical protein
MTTILTNQRKQLMTSTTNNSKQNPRADGRETNSESDCTINQKDGAVRNHKYGTEQHSRAVEVQQRSTSEKIILLEASQTENLNEVKSSYTDFLKQLADTLNSKKSGSNLEPLLQKLAEVVQENTFEVRENRESQDQLRDRVQQY